MQLQLLDVATRKGLKAVSRYWLTLSQAVRLCGTDVKPGEQAAKVLVGSSTVFPLPQGPAAASFLASHPPYFGMGVGLFSKGKWRKISGSALVERLNPQEATRRLFIDESDADVCGVPVDPLSAVEIDDISRIQLYHASQMLHPDRCAPPRGVALNAATGRRWAQPAHDVLLTAGVLCGHISPMWCTRKQAQNLFNVDICRPNNGVSVHTRNGNAFNLMDLSASTVARVFKLRPLPQQQSDVVYMLDMGNWERVDQPAMLRAMTNYSTQRLLWVTDLELQRLGIAVPSTKAKCIDLKKLTFETFFNAQDTSDPFSVQPRDRAFVLVDGRFACAQFSDQLLKVAAARQYLSPMWITKRQAASLGVRILANELPVHLSAGGGAVDHYYNVEDIVKYEDWLEANPPLEDVDAPEHQIFLVQWRPVISRGKTSTLKSFGRQLKLWISATELLISGLEVKPSAKKYRVLSGTVGRRRESQSESAQPGRTVFNAVQTSDPVRVTAMTQLLARGR